MILKSDKLIIKANELIEARYNLSINEQRFVLNYISKLNYKTQAEILSKTQTFNIRDFAREMRFKLRK